MSSLNGTLNFACTLVTSQLNKSKYKKLRAGKLLYCHVTNNAEYAQPGFPIPVVDGVSFVNPEVVLGQVELHIYHSVLICICM